MKKILFLPLLLIACCCVSQTINKIIGKPVKIGNLLVAQNDLPLVKHRFYEAGKTEVTEADGPDRKNWDDAKAFCAKLGKGWRLPTKKELKIIYNNRNKFGKNSFKDNYYWSSEKSNDLGIWYFFFPDDEFTNWSFNTDSDEEKSIRAVKSL